MVVLPSPYAYVWFDAPQRDFNVEVKVGCKDPNSVDYCEDCQVEDNNRCGPCNAGWTKTNDPNMRCWAVGSMTVDCSNGQIFYHPMGCRAGNSDNYTTDPKFKGQDCSCGGVDAKDGCGQQIDSRNRRMNKRSGDVSTRNPNIKYKPAKGKPGFTKHYSGDYSWDRVLWAVTPDGTPIFNRGSKDWVKATEESGGLIQEKVYDIIKANCGGSVSRVELSEDDRKTIPTILGESTAVAGPAVTGTQPTPASGLSNTSISTQSSNISPVTSSTEEPPEGLISKYKWPAMGVIGLLVFMKVRGGKK